MLGTYSFFWFNRRVDLRPPKILKLSLHLQHMYISGKQKMLSSTLHRKLDTIELGQYA
uniref:Uncharacterized protein n=1 Tax=Rhizophora mucronata TaxID=61149 RepID=A0A2P2IWZ1_RHIMU